MGILLSQHKYAMDIIQHAGMTSCKPVDTPLSASSKLGLVPGTLYSDPIWYRQIVRALQYLTFTRPDICYAVNKVCQFMHALCCNPFLDPHKNKNKKKKEKKKKPQNSVDTIPPCACRCPRPSGVGSCAGMGAAQAALAWCPLLPMRMLLPRSPFTQLQKGGEEFLKRREGWKTRKRGGGSFERKKNGS
jgi:hypothetical protein